MNIEQVEHLEKLLNSFKCALTIEKNLDPTWVGSYITLLHKRKTDLAHLIHACFKNMFETEEADSKADKLGEYTGFICARLRGIKEAIEKIGKELYPSILETAPYTIKRKVVQNCLAFRPDGTLYLVQLTNTGETFVWDGRAWVEPIKSTQWLQIPEIPQREGTPDEQAELGAREAVKKYQNK